MNGPVRLEVGISTLSDYEVEAYGVPIVGGHTTRIAAGAATHLGASVVGRAGKHLLTSFDAQSGDQLVFAIDLQGAYRGDKPFWNASTSSTPERLRAGLEILAQLAGRQLCRAAKDVSNGGIVGTLSMFCECSEVGVEIDLDQLPRPPQVDLLKWLLSFPSYGYLLAVAEGNLREVEETFSDQAITAKVCGTFTSEQGIVIRTGDHIERLFNSIEPVHKAWRRGTNPTRVNRLYESPESRDYWRCSSFSSRGTCSEADSAWSCF